MENGWVMHGQLETPLIARSRAASDADKADVASKFPAMAIAFEWISISALDGYLQ
jgi:hypothetical protein